MDTNELAARQAPLKDTYRADPTLALVTLRASGELDSGSVACSVDVGRKLVEAGLHPATGGDGTLACSGDMLLQALVACAGVTLRSVAVNRAIQVSGTVSAEGVLDFRGTLGIDREAPVGFVDITLHFDLRTAASDEDVASMLRSTERYCVVYQTLKAGSSMSLTSSVTA
jgi:uncharacterized OsmC-like protein